MTLERIVKLNYNSSSLKLLIVRVVDTELREPKEYRNKISEFLINKSTESQRNANLLQKAANDFMSSQLLYFKTEQIRHYYYTQFILDTQDITPDAMSIVSTLAGYMFGISYSAGWVASDEAPFYFAISAPGLPDRGLCLQVKPSRADLAVDNFINERIYTLKNNITISLAVKRIEAININTPFRMLVDIYDNLAEAINNKKTNVVSISNYDNLSGFLNFGSFKEFERGKLKLRLMYQNKDVKACYINNAIIIYDGEKSFQDALPYITKWTQKDIGLNFIDILQFNKNKDFFYHENLNGNYLKKLVLHFMDKRRILQSRSNFDDLDRGLYGRIAMIPQRGQKIRYIDLTYYRNASGYMGDLIVPVNNDNIQREALRYLDNIVTAYSIRRENPAREDLINYVNLIMNTEKQMEDEGDVLNAWFKNCLKVSKRNEKNILYAYEQMKVNLEKEYKNLQAYIKTYDFSKCKAVPSIKMDKKLKKNYYKTLHIDLQNSIINKIKNKKIKEIHQITPMIVSHILDSRNILRTKHSPLYDYYDKMHNCIDLKYSVLKGDIIHDKIKNRR